MANGLGGFTSALGQFFTGMGQDQQNAAAAQERAQAAQRAEQLQAAQISNYQSEAAQRAATAAREERKRAIISEHAQKALAGDQQSIAAIAAVAPEMLATLTKPEPAARNIDPLSPAGLKAAKELAAFQASLQANKDPMGGRPNEGNLKNAAFAAIADKEAPALKDMGATVGSTLVGRVPLVGNSILANGVLGTNWLKDPKYQAQQLAGDRWIMQWLRSTSGAAIGNDELKNYRKQYIPQPGDAPETLKAKEAARTDVMGALNTMAGPAGRKPLPPRGSVQPQQGNAPRGNVTLGDDPIMAKFGLAPKKGAH